MSLGVSRISFGEASANVNPQDILKRPGAYSRPVENQINIQDNKPEKKSGIGKKILYTAGTLAVIAGALYALPKFLPRIFDAAKNLEGLKGFNKYKSYVTTYIAKVGEWIGEKSTNLYDKGAKLLHIKK